MPSTAQKILQRFQGLVWGDGVKDSSLYLDDHAVYADVLGTGAADPALRVRSLRPSNNAPADLLILYKDGSLVFRGPGPWIDVRAYGAKGDGVTDDTAAIQAAIDALGFPGGTVYLPGLFYRITSTLYWNKSGVRFVGAAGTDGSTRLRWDGAAGGIMIAVGGAAYGTRIEGLEMDALSTNYPGVGIWLAGGNHLSVRDVQAQAITKYGIILGDLPTAGSPSGAITATGAISGYPATVTTLQACSFQDNFVAGRTGATGLYVNQGQSEELHFKNFSVSAPGFGSGVAVLARSIQIDAGFCNFDGLVTTNGPANDYSIKSSAPLEINDWTSEDPIPLYFNPVEHDRPSVIRKAILRSVKLYSVAGGGYINPAASGGATRAYAIHWAVAAGAGKRGALLLDGVSIARDPSADNGGTQDLFLGSTQEAYIRGLKWEASAASGSVLTNGSSPYILEYADGTIVGFKQDAGPVVSPAWELLGNSGSRVFLANGSGIEVAPSSSNSASLINLGGPRNNIRSYSHSGIANSGTNQLAWTADFTGLAFITDDRGHTAIFQIGGALHATQEIADPDGLFSVTAGTATSINVYWSGTRYEIQNLSGGTRTYNVMMFTVT